MAGSDAIWVRGEASPRSVSILEEGDREVSYSEEGKKKTVESWRVRGVRRGDTPEALEAALAKLPLGDFAGAEKALGELEDKREPAWLHAHASFHRANARRLRAVLEGTGHEEALAALQAWSEREKGHFLWPHAALATGLAAIEARKPEVARTAFDALAERAGPWGLHGKRGAALVRRADDLEGIEREALADEWSHEVAQLCRIDRAELLSKKGEHAAAAKLLTDVVDLEAWAGAPARARALNVLAEIAIEVGGRTEAGEPRPESLLAASPFWLRVVRHHPWEPIDRAQALAGAYKAALAGGAKERAEILKAELCGRFGGSRWANGF